MVDYKEKLIIAVQDFPALYDHTRNDYKNLQRKNLWEQARGGSHIDMVYVYVPAFWVTFSRNLV